MSDEKEKKFDHLSPEQAEKAKKAAEQKAAIAAAKALENEDSQWSIVQEMLQEIQAAYLVVSPDAKPPVTKMIDDLKKELRKKYSDEPEVAKILIDSIPSARSVRVWLKKDGWDDAVWTRIRQDELFSPGRRSEVIKALHQRACDKSDQAAKIYLTLSGDYVEKEENNDSTVDTYREIQKVLQGNRKKED